MTALTIFGYTSAGNAVLDIPEGFVASSASVTCQMCGKVLRSCGGPLRAYCVPCWAKKNEVKPNDPMPPIGPLDLTAPSRVWLQVDTNGDNDDRSEQLLPDAWSELSWHYEPLGGQEVEYVRRDLAGDLKPQIDPVVVVAQWPDDYPYYGCTPAQWEKYTAGMTERGVRALANMLAHHCLLTQRDDHGWILTRFDLINQGKPFWHISNDGKLTYDYDPATMQKRVPTPPKEDSA